MSASEDENELDSALKRALFAQAIPAWIVGLLTSLVCAAFLYGQFEGVAVIWWGLAAFAASMLRLPIILMARKRQDADLPVNAYTAIVATTGLIWGLLALFMSPDLALADQLIILVAPIILSVGGIVSFSPWRLTFISFVFCSLVPLILIMAFYDTAGISRLVLPMLFVLMACMFMGNRFHKQYRETLSLRLRNQRLLGDLSVQNDSLILARDEARAACQSKDEFLARMSHELRTPMNGVLGISQIVSRTSLDPEQDRLMSSLQKSGEEMLKLIDNLLGASSLVTGDVVLDQRPYQIVHVIESIRLQKSALIEQKSLTFDLHIDEDVPQCVIGDERRMGQVLGALVDNAIKFTTHGGIKLKVSRQPTGRALSHAENHIEDLLFEISDTGPGIEASQLHRVNELFHQIDGDSSRRFGGSGLGLSIANSLVELMKGKLSVTSALCEGTRVAVRVPLQEAPHDASVDVKADAINTAKESKSGKRRVLVVEDNPINQMVIEAILKELGCEITLAENGLLAIQALEEQGFDIVFMDCQMPELDGYSATRRARASGFRIPIVAVTANAMAGDRQKCLSAGMNDYVSKPINKDTIMHMLNKWIGPDSLKLAG